MTRKRTDVLAHMTKYIKATPEQTLETMAQLTALLDNEALYGDDECEAAVDLAYETGAITVAQYQILADRIEMARESREES